MSEVASPLVPTDPTDPTAAFGAGTSAHAVGPAPLEIHVRTPDLDLDSEIPRHWCRNEAFATHVLDGLSGTFPVGESFFVRSVMRYPEAFKDDPELAAAVRAFAGQEGRHSHEHARHLEMLDAHGYSGIRLRNALVEKILRFSNKWQPVTSLAATAAVEHLTAILARVVLNGDRMVYGMDPRMKSLWQWHALEEAEHKSVAYDVFMRVSGSYPLRVWILAINTLGLFVEIMDRAVYMLWKDGELFKRKTWSDGWRFLFACGQAASGEDRYQPRGILRGLGPEYWAWYRREFHPADHDDSELIAKYRDQFSKAMPR